MRRVACLLALALLAALTSCSSAPPLASGTVERVKFRAEWTEQRMVCIMYGKYGCASYMPETEHHDPEWAVFVRGTDKDGKPRAAWIDVDESTFPECVVGSTYARGSCK